MKLQAELEATIERIEALKTKVDVLAYREQLRRLGNFNNFEVRFVNDIKTAIFTIDEICDMYDKYQCNDTHITSLMRAACKKTGII